MWKIRAATRIFGVGEVLWPVLCGNVHGKRNKGREFVRKIKTADGKIVKKKKKGKGKKLGMADKPAGTTIVSGNLQIKFLRQAVRSSGF